MNIWTHNWSHAIKLVSFLVIHNTLFNAKELEGGFIEYKATGFQRIAHKRLHHLVKSRIFWDIHELAMTYIKTYNDQITSDIPKAIQLILTGMTIQTPYKLSLLANNLIQTLDYRIQKFSVLTEALGNLSFILEKENMRLEHVDQFHNIPNVQSIVKNLENSYNDLKDFLSQPIDATPLP